MVRQKNDPARLPPSAPAKKTGAAKVSDAGQILSGLLKARHLEKKFEEYSAFPYWREVVGDEIAKVAVPERIQARKVLVVRVVDAVWAQELAVRKVELLEKLAELNTGALIQDIRFVTGNKKDFKTSE